MSESDATASDSAEIRVQGGNGVEVAEEAGAAPGETDTYSSCGVCGMRFPTRRGASGWQNYFHVVRPRCRSFGSGSKTFCPSPLGGVYIPSGVVLRT